MNSDILSYQVQAMQRRVSALYQQATPTAGAELLSQAFEELQTALEQLESASDLLQRTQHALAAARDAQQQERQQSIDTFNNVPVAYIITGVDGTIKRLNHAAATLLNQTEKFLHGKSLGVFIPEGERRAFRAELDRLHKLSAAEERVFRLQPNGMKPMETVATIGISRDRAGRAVAFHWLLRVASMRREADSFRGDSYARA